MAETHTFGVGLLKGITETFYIRQTGSDEIVCKLRLTLREHPQVIGAWILDIEGNPGDGSDLTMRQSPRHVEYSPPARRRKKKEEPEQKPKKSVFLYTLKEDEEEDDAGDRWNQK